MTTDRVGFVKQAAYISLSMLLINTPHGYKTNDQGKYAKELKEKLEKMCQSRHEESLVRFGCMISLGLLEAGGRNQTIQLFSKYTTYKRNAAIAGILLFTQYYYWFPCTSFIALCFKPAAIMGINEDLKMPVTLSWICSAKKSEFDYPPKKEEKKSKTDDEVKKVVLSTNKRKQARENIKHSKEDNDMDVEEKKSESPKIEEKADKDEKTEIDKKEEEPEFYNMSNPSRVLPYQEKFIIFDENERYIPIVSRKSGIIMLKDTQKGNEDAFVGDNTERGGKDATKQAAPLNHETTIEAPKPFEVEFD